MFILTNHTLTVLIYLFIIHGTMFPLIKIFGEQSTKALYCPK